MNEDNISPEQKIAADATLQESYYAWFNDEWIMCALPKVLDMIDILTRDRRSREEIIEAAETMVEAALYAFMRVTVAEKRKQASQDECSLARGYQSTLPDRRS
ncbi:hypothetical protein SODG_000160 [Sodalis praecaptivus]|uniref:hypothetical protein n=1 Tax=Sodalis praecaptivus TaxID=1239307 RepID=UPI0027F31537|nr:hypothetical protein [Sodalis praecaptivus]CAJ0999084.1 hypothetical protein NVIRENTERO_03645 [Sodalis praecaptivus]